MNIYNKKKAETYLLRECELLQIGSVTTTSIAISKGLLHNDEHFN